MARLLVDTPKKAFVRTSRRWLTCIGRGNQSGTRKCVSARALLPPGRPLRMRLLALGIVLRAGQSAPGTRAKGEARRFKYMPEVGG